MPHSAAGPLITVLQAILVFLFFKSRNWSKNLYLLLFTAFYMRLMAGLMNVMNPNDEGRISTYFGIGLFTLPAVVSGFLFFLVYRISQKYKLGWKFQLSTTLIVMVASSILILADQFIGIRLL